MSWQISAEGLNRKDIYMSMNNICDIAWNGNFFLTVGEGGHIVKSFDGVKWQSLNAPLSIYKDPDNFFPVSFEKVIYDGERFIVFSGSYKAKPSLILTSDYSEKWQELDSNLSDSIVDIVFENDKYKALVYSEEDNQKSIYTSKDLIVWTEALKVNQSSFKLLNFDKDLFVLSEDNKILVINHAWETSEHDVPHKARVNDICNFGDSFIFVGENEAIYRSNNNFEFEVVQYKDWYNLKSVTWNGKIYCAVGDSGTILTSPDGINWTKADIREDYNLNSVVWLNGKFIAGGSCVLISQDGKDWHTTFELPEDEIIRNIVYDGKYVYLVGQTSVFQSVDGTDWEPCDEKNSAERLSLEDKGTLLCNISVDKYHSAGFNDDELKNIIYNTAEASIDGKSSIIIEQNFIYLVTEDGKSLKNVFCTDYEQLNDIVWNGNQYMSVGTKGTLVFSEPDKFIAVGSFLLRTRQQTGYPTNNDLNGIAWNGYRYVAVGDNNTIITWVPQDIVKILVNNNPVVFDVAPKIANGRTLVPLRSIFEKMGSKVLWDGTTQTVTVSGNNTEIKLKIGEKTASINGVDHELDVPAEISNGRTLIPLRFISESLGAKVHWNESDRAVYIDLN